MRWNGHPDLYRNAAGLRRRTTTVDASRAAAWPQGEPPLGGTGGYLLRASLEYLNKPVSPGLRCGVNANCGTFPIWGTPAGTGVAVASGAVATAESAQNVVNGVRLSGQLARESANSAFTASGELSQGAISGARQIFAPGTLGNPAIPNTFGKYTTETFASPSGPFQAHFYMNPTTGEVMYGLDYKVMFNLGF
jgi:hypothetical protein